TRQASCDGRSRLWCFIKQSPGIGKIPLSPLRIVFETRFQQASNLYWHPFPDRFFSNDCCQRVGDVFSFEQSLPSENLVQDNAECPYVRTLIDLLAARLLRRHVCSRAQDDTCLCCRNADGR